MSKPVVTQPDLRNLTYAEVAELYSVKPETVEKWVRDGKVPRVQIGGVNRIPLSYLENLHRAANPAVDEAIAAIIAAAPPLTDDQRNRISALLRTGSTERVVTGKPNRKAVK